MFEGLAPNRSLIGSQSRLNYRLYSALRGGLHEGLVKLTSLEEAILRATND